MSTEKKKVVIIGGGVAGMSAAHELIERGFEVDVYEKQPEYVGGKARSVNVPGTNTQFEDKYLPGEHGFRFFPGFYKHVTDTMKRTPLEFKDGVASKKTAFDNLVDTETIKISRDKGREPIVFPTDFLGSWADLKMVYKLYKNRKSLIGLKPGESALFKSKILQLMCSCNERREAEYEKTSWWEFLEADGKSDDYVHLLVIGVTRTLVAADARKASTKTDGNIILQLLYNFLNPTIRTDRLFNAPTNEAWLTPWHNYLTQKGVRYHHGWHLHNIKMDETGKVSQIEVRRHGETMGEHVKGDYFLLAVPVDMADKHISPEMKAIDPSLAKLDVLAQSMSWMTGMQFYLNTEVNINPGHVNYAYSEWALTSVDQMRFWDNYDLKDRFNGKIKSILSVDISDWLDTPFEGNPADADNIEKIKEGVWEQLENSLNVEGQPKVLDAKMIEHYYLDSDIILYPDKKAENKERMLVNTINSWELRPEATTKIPNFFLASDYVRTYTDLATMEAANEAARRAVNGIIDASGVKADKCEVWPLVEPALFNPVKWYDRKRFKKNLPYATKMPIWLKAVMIVWGGLYAIYFLLKILVFKLFGLKPK